MTWQGISTVWMIVQCIFAVYIIVCLFAFMKPPPGGEQLRIVFCLSQAAWDFQRAVYYALHHDWISAPFFTLMGVILLFLIRDWWRGMRDKIKTREVYA